jgi:CubicO group peptidase (beta-lactamase class C family)
VSNTSNCLAVAALLLVSAGRSAGLAQAGGSSDAATFARIDSVFGEFTSSTPGCAVGVGRRGRTVFARGYGLANLEYRVPITDSTVFESGSVAKQFTAGAIVLLSLENRLSLDDDIRKYVPEVPAFGGARITIMQMLSHTSGIRDLWALLAIEGRAEGRTLHTASTVLDLVEHQRTLNFRPGSMMLYSNTPYILLAMVVERVSGQSFDQFMQERFFRPLAMTQSQWRDDFTEIVPGRATAYSGSITDSFRTNMPFMNLVGSGGLLLTVHDALKWNRNLDDPRIGGARWRNVLQTRGTLNNGRRLTYSLGLQSLEYRGTTEIGHDGNTAGYDAALVRYPEHDLSIAVLCNLASAGAINLSHAVADLFLPRATAQTATDNAPAFALSTSDAQAWVGLYRDSLTDGLLELTVRDGRIALAQTAPQLRPESPNRLRSGTTLLELVGNGGAKWIRRIRSNGDTSAFVPVAPADTTAAALRDFEGLFVSDELEVQLSMVVRDGALMRQRRRGNPQRMRPVYRDGFTIGEASFRFLRDASGRVTGFKTYQGRVLAVEFKKADPVKTPQ